MPRGALSVFLPWSLYGLLDEAAAGRAARRTCAGALLFCDVAGFTPLTEALSVLGREGAEELTRLLNGYFTRMIGILSEEGGDVLRFGGDAMTVFFPGESRARAARGALRMMAAMEEFSDLPTRAGRFTLSMKVGGAYGAVHLGLVGAPESGWDYYAAGVPLDDAADAEHHAAAGHVVLHASFASGAPPSLVADPIEGGFVRLTRFSGEPAMPLRPPDPPRDDLLLRFVPRHLAERAGEGIMGEHRGTAVAFLSVAGLGWEDPAAAHGALQTLFVLLAATARRYGGSVNKLDFGDKGAKAILLFGAPFACERKEEMAARASLELLGSPDLPEGLRLRAGLTAAPLFSGPVGSPGRREFTVMGDGINLAARLMAAAETGRVLASREIADAAGASLKFTALPPIAVKGKRDPVPVFLPQGERSEARASEHALLLEREAAQEALRACLFEGRGAPVLVEAEAGLGKSALAAWALREALAREIPAVLVPLAPFSTEREYSAFKAPVRVRLGAEKGDGADRLRLLRDRALASEDPGFRPLLNPFLDLPPESTAALRALSPKERKELTFAVVKRLFDGGGERVLLFDGLQWADPLSLDLFSFLSADAPGGGWRMALFTRPDPDLSPSLRERCAQVPLPPLSPGATQALLVEGYGLSAPSGAGGAWFDLKSRGNPAVVAALVRSLVGEGLLSRDAAGRLRLDEDRLSTTAFPDTLEGLYLQQVDALTPAERLVLQEASALGSSVSLNLLAAVSSVGDAERGAALASLAARGLLREDTRGVRPYVRFAETLLRDAVYTALPFALGRPLHLRIFEALLDDNGGDTPHLWPTLAHHAERGGDEIRARRFHRLAGREALSRFDNLSALRHLEFVCGTLSPQAEEVEDAFALMDAYGHLGRNENAARLLQRLVPLSGTLAPAQGARLLFFEARALWQSQAWGGAEEKLLEGLALYRSCGDTSGEGKSYVNLVGGVYGPTGQLDKAREALEKALALPRGPNQSSWRTTAAMNLGVVLWYSGRQQDAAEAFRSAYRDAVRGKLGPQKGMIADNLCALLGEMGRFGEAVLWGRRAITSLEAFAVRGTLQNARYNLALAQLANGRTREVNHLLTAVAVACANQANLQTLGRAFEGLAQAAALDGDAESVLTHARRALEVLARIDAGRDYRFTLAIVGNLFRGVDAKGRWREFLAEVGAPAFLERGAPDAAADGALRRLERWSAGVPHEAPPETGPTPGGGGSPEEALELGLWAAEEAVSRGDSASLPTRLPSLRMALSRWSYFDARLRLLRLELLASAAPQKTLEAEALRLTSRCLGGMWGLRLLCLLWAREPSRARARALRLKSLRALYFVHAHSPGWAWEKIVAFPEVRAVLRGLRP